MSIYTLFYKNSGLKKNLQAISFIFREKKRQPTCVSEENTTKLCLKLRDLLEWLLCFAKFWSFVRSIFPLRLFSAIGVKVAYGHTY